MRHDLEFVASLCKTFERPQRILNVARYLELIVERASDDSVAVDNVSHAGRAQPESAFNVVEPAYLPRLVAPKVERSSDGLTEALHSVHAIGTNPDDDRITGGEFIMRLAESTDLGRASGRKGPRVKEQNDVSASVL